MSLLRTPIAAWSRHRYACLLVSLALTLGAAPLLDALGRDPVLLEAFLALNLVAAALGTPGGRTFRGILVLGAIAFAAMALRLIPGAASFLTVSHATWSIVVLLAIASILRTVLRSGPVDSERICAALSVYLLFGLVCGVLFGAFERVWPGSVSSPDPGAGGSLALRDAIYFSFVTLATLGYGDFVPVSQPARSLAIVEGVGGQLYLVVLVARLVGLYGARRDGGPPR